MGWNEDLDQGQVVKFKGLFGYDDIHIFADDFECSVVNDCEIVSEMLKTFEFKNKAYNYITIMLPINMINEKFNEKVSVKYIKDKKTKHDENTFGVIKGSTFTEYLYKQNSQRGYKIIFKFDSFNNFKFSYGIYERDKFKYNPLKKINTKFILNQKTQQNIYSGCFTNDFDAFSKHSYLGVKESEYVNWLSFFINVLKDSVPGFDVTKDSVDWNEVADILDDFEMKFYFEEDQDNVLGSMVVKGDEIVDVEREEVNLMQIDSGDYDFIQGSELCDFYFGPRLLQKYNFKFYYVEYDLDYEVYYSYDQEFTKPTKNKHSTGWIAYVICIYIVLLLVLGYCRWDIMR